MGTELPFDPEPETPRTRRRFIVRSRNEAPAASRVLAKKPGVVTPDGPLPAASIPPSTRKWEFPKITSATIALIVILFVAAGLRFYGMQWGKNLYLHPDERFQTMVVTGISWPDSIGEYFNSETSPLNPYNRNFPTYIYGTFPLFMAKLAGSISGNDLYGNAHYPGRFLSGFIDLLSVLLIYFIGKRLFTIRTGLLAAALMAGSVLQLQTAHFFTSDSYVLMFCLAAFYAAIRAGDTGKTRWYIAAGMAVGLAIASKLSALPIFLVLVMPVAETWRVHGWRAIFRGPQAKRIAPVVGVAVALLALIWTFRIVQPYAFAGGFFSFRLDERWLNDVKYWRVIQSGESDTPPNLQWADRPPFLFGLKNLVLWGMGPFLGITALIGLATASVGLVARRRCPPFWQLFIVGWSLFHLGYYGISFVQTLRYYLPAYGFLILLAAAILIRFYDWGRARNWPSLRLPVGGDGKYRLPLSAIPAIVVLFATLFYAVAFDNIYTPITTREEASRWIYANIPAGATIASEHWDDGIPVGLPGFSPQDYPSFQLENYALDNEEKLDKLLDQLDEADFLVLTSNRLYEVIPRLPERFPMTTEYYRMLFANELGFDLVQTFTSYPNFAGITLNDDHAEEAFTVYDHPKVLIFEKSANYNRASFEPILREALGNGGVAFPPTQVGENMLMMDEETRIAQQTGGTWSDIFHPGDIANRFPVPFWYLAMQMMALLAVPFCWRLLPALPDRGYAVAKTFGLLIVTWMSWFLASIKILDFGLGTIVVGFVGLGALSLAVVWRQREEFRDELRQRWRLVVFIEGLFLVVFLGGVWLRMQNPDLWDPGRGGEKPMDFAYFNAVIRSTSFPPFDPWFAGGIMHYYYYGFTFWATLTRLTGIVPEMAYNLAVPSIFALLVLNSWSVAFGFIRKLRPDLTAWRPVVVAMIAPLFVAIIGNLDLAIQIGRGVWDYPESWPVRIFPSFLGFPEIIGGIWNTLFHQPVVPRDAYWSPTRIVPGTINEFPYFSILFADLHAHLMAMPLATGALVLAVQVLFTAKRPVPDGGKDGTNEEFFQPERGWRFAFAFARSRKVWEQNAHPIALAVFGGFIVSALYATNTWDFPAYFVTLVIAYLISRGTRSSWSGWFALVRDVGIWAAILFVSGRVLFFPFYSNFSGAAKFIRTYDRTSLSDYLKIDGIFLFLIGGYIALELGTWANGKGIRLPWPTRLSVSKPRYRDPDTRQITLTVNKRSTNYARWLIAIPSLGVLVALAKNDLIIFLVSALSLTFIAAWWRRYDPLRLGYLFLIAAGLGLSGGVEFYTIADDVGRMNSVFKVYLEIWILFGIAAAVAVGVVATNGRAMRDARGRIWLIGGTILVLGGMVYPLVVTAPRVADRFNAISPTLDGMAFMNDAVYIAQADGREPVEVPLAEDLQAIDWLRANVIGSPVILEATLPGYRWGSRISIYTGMPTVLGWDWHQTQQRRGYGQLVTERREDVQRMFGDTVPFEEITPLLDQYHVRFIYVGGLERAYYDEAALQKFSDAASTGQLEIVYQENGVIIYAYNGSA